MLSTVNICFFEDGSKLVKERCSDGPRFAQRALISNHWETVNEWDDTGHVANLLVKHGYESEHLPAIKLLNIL
jgi:hypothetical protein